MTTSAELRRVLYVEDDPDIRSIATMALEAVGGLEVRACSSGAEALEAAAGFAPDVLVLDVMMPGMDGPATLAGLRQQPGTAATPVIFMTAKVQASEVQGYHALGAIGVITKPFDPMGLADQVRSLWNQAPRSVGIEVQYRHEVGYVVATFSGEAGIEEFLSALQQVGADSVAWPQSRVLVDLRALRKPFSFTEQMRIGEAVGRNFAHLRRAAALVPPERITNVGVKAANRTGARAAAFGTEAEALTWLLQGPA